MSEPIDRRRFLGQAATGLGALSALSLGCEEEQPKTGIPHRGQLPEADLGPPVPYNGPRVVLVRFGVRCKRRLPNRPRPPIRRLLETSLRSERLEPRIPNRQLYRRISRLLRRTASGSAREP